MIAASTFVSATDRATPEGVAFTVGIIAGVLFIVFYVIKRR